MSQVLTEQTDLCVTAGAVSDWDTFPATKTAELSYIISTPYLRALVMQ